MFKGILNNPKHPSPQDPARGTQSNLNHPQPGQSTFIDALGTSGQISPIRGNETEANKENRPDLFVNIGAPITPRAINELLPSSPSKRTSLILSKPIPGTNTNGMHSNNTNKNGGSEYIPRSRKGTGDLNVDPTATAGRTAQRNVNAIPGTQSNASIGNANPWGFEFLDHPPPPRTSGRSTPVEKMPPTDATHSEFNKMLDDLQIPSSLRPKLEGLDTPVKAAMIRSNQVLAIPPVAATAVALPPSPTKSSRFGKEKEKEKDKKKDKFKTETFKSSKPSHAPNPFMFNRSGNTSNKGTPTKGGLRRTQSSGSLNDSPKGIPYSQMPPANNSAYNLALGPGEEAAMQFMFPSLDDSDPLARSSSPPLLPPPTLAQLQDGTGGSPYGNGRSNPSHVRGSSFDSSSPRPVRVGTTSGDSTMQFNAQGMSKIGSRSTVYLEGTGSSWMGTSNGSGSAFDGSGNEPGSWTGSGSATNTTSGISMGMGNRSRVRVGSGPKGQSILVKERAVSRERKETDKSAASKDGKPIPPKERDWTPEKFSTMLAQTKSIELDVERLKKLRIMLRNEAASWSEGFLIGGGYSNLLSRLNEILEVEWREEQRDDQILHELLRCFKALSTSSIGCFALRSSSPRPFVQLVSLLYSDKKPGDVASRLLIIELLVILAELYPTIKEETERPLSLLGLTTSPRLPSSPSPAPKSQYPLPAPHNSLFSLLRAVFLTPKPLPSECPSMPISAHAFIESLHHPRIYKSYLTEVSDVCRDYFWVFCHPGNTIWDMQYVDIAKVEAPKAPGGMTGGVEFEAMGYLTMHFKLLNALAKATAELKLPPDNELSAARFHRDMLMSGIERIIASSRKASTVYYPTLHLEIARFVQLMKESGTEIPYGLQRLFGPPPTNLCKPGFEVPAANPNPPVKAAGAKNINHARGASSAAVLGGGVSPIKAGGGGYQGYQGDRPKGAAPPVLPPPKF